MRQLTMLLGCILASALTASAAAGEPRVKTSSIDEGHISFDMRRVTCTFAGGTPPIDVRFELPKSDVKEEALPRLDIPGLKPLAFDWIWLNHRTRGRPNNVSKLTLETADGSSIVLQYGGSPYSPKFRVLRATIVTITEGKEQTIVVWKLAPRTKTSSNQAMDSDKK